MPKCFNLHLFCFVLLAWRVAAYPREFPLYPNDAFQSNVSLISILEYSLLSCGEPDVVACDIEFNSTCIISTSRRGIGHFHLSYSGNVFFTNSIIDCVLEKASYSVTIFEICASGNVTFVNSTVHCPMVVVTSLETVTIDAASTLSTDATSYYRSSHSFSSSFSGGSYGGVGGSLRDDCAAPEADLASSGLLTYGDSRMPRHLGSMGLDVRGGDGMLGGGKLFVSSRRDIIHDGTLSSNGESSSSSTKSAGSGGSVVLRATQLLSAVHSQLSGRVLAVGGTCAGRDMKECACGGGGRVALLLEAPHPLSPVVLAAGGYTYSGDLITLPCRCGGAGTIYSSYLHRLIVYNRPHCTYKVMKSESSNELLYEETPPPLPQLTAAQPTPIDNVYDGVLSIEVDTAVVVPAVAFSKPPGEPFFNVSSLQLQAGVTGLILRDLVN